MPLLGADMTAGRLVQWYKKPGDTVQRGDIIAEVDTDKGAIDIEVFTSGVLERLLVQPGEKVPVGTPLAIIREAGE
jgi:pyruvate dehydrogenase E2 component (dihydrolipoamide acetyltransferase)